jgi:TPR repeat protein
LLLCFAGSLLASVEHAKDCADGNASACYNLGKSYENAPNWQRNYAMAQEAYKKACDLKDAYSCYKVGYMYYEYLYNGIKANRTAAVVHGLA